MDAKNSVNIKNKNKYNEQPVLYVYPGEVCSKRKKKSQIYNAYNCSENKKGYGDNKNNYYHIRSDKTSKNIKSNYKNLNENIRSENDNGRVKQEPLNNKFVGNAYKVRYNNYDGGERAEPLRRKKITIESIINLFGTTEERRRGDIEDAKQKAASRRRSIEHKRGLILAVLILAIFAIILLAIYKVFFVVRAISVEGTSVYTSEEIISASGVRKGVNLYSFRSSSANNNVTFYCPYIQKVDVHRNVPSGVLLEVTEDVPMYYAEVYGEYKVLSDGLRVLDTVDADDEILSGLTKLKLPAVSYSVAGRVIEFANVKDERSVRDVLSSINASLLSQRVTMADLSDTYDMSISIDKKFLLEIGNTSDIDLKLKTAAYVLEDDMFSTGNKARIDLKNTEKTSVIIDNKTKTE